MTKSAAADHELITQTVLDHFHGDVDLHVKVDHVGDDIASVTVRSAILHKYLQLARAPAGWKIAYALCHPR